MLKLLPAPILGALNFLFLVLNTVIWAPLLLVLALVKLILPWPVLRRRMNPVLTAIAENWIDGNKLWMVLTQRTGWHVTGGEGLDRRGWYLVNANHQSWVDIFVLQKVFNRKIPLLKFFLKADLIKVPVMGLAWWALDFPFMRRYSKSYLKKHPEMRGKDLEVTRKACRKFALQPTSVMNFMEGTRFNPSKHAAQSSPYKYLLKPKSGGVGLALSALGEKFNSFINVTIVYPDGTPTFWDFLCGRVTQVVVQVEKLQIPADILQGDYAADNRFRTRFHQWVQEIWQAKDELIAELLMQYRTSS